MDDLTPINKRYLLVTNIQIYCDDQGRMYLGELWYKDLIEHLRYLKEFTLACPCKHGQLPESLVPLDSEPSFSDIRIIGLPSVKSFAEAIILLPVTVTRLWHAIGESDIVHTGIAGWPIPMGWLITPLLQIRRKFYIIIVESAPWRLKIGIPYTITSQIKAYIYEKLAAWCVNNTDLAIFTQAEYKESFLTKSDKQGYIINASWINEADIISEADAISLWQEKVLPPNKNLKVLFVGRLTQSKGILVLLEAMKVLEQEKIPVQLDILGEGELFHECEKISNNLGITAEIRMLGTLAYGEAFFNLLRKYHAIIVPSISDEQPRIVYDAYSQAIPVLASDTPGLRECIQNGETGMLVNSNNSIALANLLKWSWQNLNELESMGIKAITVAQNLTHQKMHEKRWKLLLQALDVH